MFYLANINEHRTDVASFTMEYCQFPDVKLHQRIVLVLNCSEDREVHRYYRASACETIQSAI